jgi:hypothetical protein
VARDDLFPGPELLIVAIPHELDELYSSVRVGKHFVDMEKVK